MYNFLILNFGLVTGGWSKYIIPLEYFMLLVLESTVSLLCYLYYYITPVTTT